MDPSEQRVARRPRDHATRLPPVSQNVQSSARRTRNFNIKSQNARGPATSQLPVSTAPNPYSSTPMDPKHYKAGSNLPQALSRYPEAGHSGRTLRRINPSIKEYTERARTPYTNTESPRPSVAPATESSWPLSPSPVKGGESKIIPSGNANADSRTMATPTRTERSYSAARQKSPIPELRGLARVVPTQAPMAETPISLATSTPSTFYSDSVGPWSSRNTTPMSLPSYSPGLSAASGPKLASPFRGEEPKVQTAKNSASGTKPPLQRSYTTDSEVSVTQRSPSSQSQASIPKTPAKLRKKKSRKQKSPVPRLSPPPRKSSMKFQSPSGKSAKSDLTGSPRPLREEHLSSTFQVDMEGHKGLSEADLSQAAPPRRPSRQGTSHLPLEASPIIQSDLPPEALSRHKKRSGSAQEEPRHRGHMAPTISSANKIQPVVVPRSGSRQQSPSVDSAQASRQGIPYASSVTSPQLSSTSAKERRGSNESSSRSGKFASRFGFFSRSKKPRSESEGESQKPKSVRKGPAAGTGHEGYGKYAQRGRRTSLGSNVTSRGRSTSTADSTARSGSSWRHGHATESESELDEFVTQRLDPIVIQGGGGVPGDKRGLRRMQSSLLGETREQTQQQNTIVANRLSPEEVASRNQTDRPRSIAERRSMRRLRDSGGSLESIRVPSPIKTTGLDTSQSVTTLDSMNSPIPRSDSTVPPTSVSSAGDIQKKPKSSRWNPFSRSRRHRKSKSPSPERRHIRKDVSVTVARVPETRPVPFYALMDSEYEDQGLSPGTSNLEEIMQAVDASPPEEEDTSHKAKDLPGLGLHSGHGESILLPSPPNFNSMFAWESIPQPVPTIIQPTIAAVARPDDAAEAHEKQARLSPVGRIPAIVSNKGKERQQPAQSFSRPFVTSKLQRQGNIEDIQASNEIRPPLGVQTDPLPSRLFSNDPDSGHPYSAPAEVERPVKSPLSQSEFLTYPSWYGSRSSTSSCSNGAIQHNFQQTHRPTTMGARTGEDEIWKEYDDLIDHVLEPIDTRSTDQTSCDDNPSQAVVQHAPSQYLQPPRQSVTTVPSSPALTSVASAESVRLRRSKIASALRSSQDPSTPSTLAELVAQYEERNRNSTILLNRMSYLFEDLEDEDEASPSLVPEPLHTANVANAPSKRARTTILLDIAERYREGPVGLSNLRYGALMISRWLSFSRVLFSPAHTKIMSEPGERVLVLDGLGNDDWSYYCAETYSTANIYSLNSMIQATTASREAAAEAWPAPPNHKAVRLNSSTFTFPFPQSYFAAVVFRFPAAMPESTLKRTMGECYRVLRPGGYIEMAVMDLDMVNMGNRTRRAVRMLKVRMNVADAGISLKPASDNVLKILGRRGFQNLNKCIVSVPVAGIVTSSSMGSASSRHSQGSTSRQETISVAGSKAASFTDPDIRASSSSASERNFLLSDLIADNSPKSDQRITKMVAKVGRWWYTRCYEWAVLPDGDLQRSIWADEKVLQECENRSSGFKLLIAYAQKPLDARRRTLSEPSKPTGAIAGGPRPIAHLHESL